MARDLPHDGMEHSGATGIAWERRPRIPWNHGVPERPTTERLRRTRGRAKTRPPRGGVIERGRDALVYEQLGPLAANGPATDSCFSRLIMVARPFAVSLVIP